MIDYFFEIKAKVKSLVITDTLTASSFSTNNCVFSYFHFSYKNILSRGKHNCLHAKSRHKREKFLHHQKNKAGMPILAGNKELSANVFSHRTCAVRLLTDTVRT